MDKPPQKDPLIGRSIDGKYTIVESIGRGGMGSVYRARQDAINRDVAIKFLSIASFGESRERYVERFKREAETASQIRHPSAITIYDYGVAQVFGEDETPYLVMEFISGHTLKQLITDAPLPAERVVPLIVQVCGALHEAHKLGIIHRDLKPENIMVSKSIDGHEWAHVLDFGIAKRLEQREEDVSLTKTGSVMGTPKYMAPEQIWQKQVDQRTDIYSLAVVLYECLSCKLPFEGTSLMDVAIKTSTEEPTPLSKRAPGIALAKPLEKVLMRALNKDPNERPETAERFASELVKASPPTFRFSSGSLSFSRVHQAIEDGTQRKAMLGLLLLLPLALVLWTVLPLGGRENDSKLPTEEINRETLERELLLETEREEIEQERARQEAARERILQLEKQREAALEEEARRLAEVEAAQAKEAEAKKRELAAEQEKLRKLEAELKAKQEELERAEAEEERKREEIARRRRVEAERQAEQAKQLAEQRARAAERRRAADALKAKATASRRSSSSSIPETPEPQPSATPTEASSSPSAAPPKLRRRCGPTWCP